LQPPFELEKEMSLETLLVRADASPEIGAGHVMRCFALAQEWRDQGSRVIFAMAESTASVRARLVAEDCEVVDVPAPAASDEDCEWLVQYANKNRPAWIVLDGYRFGAEYHQGVRKGPWGLLCIDDAGSCGEHGADLILNQNVTATPEMYRKGTRSRHLLGPRYVLLRKEFSRWLDWKRTVPPIATSVLVTLGGSTQLAVARTVLAALARVHLDDLAVNFVVGGSTSRPELIEQATSSPAVTFVRNPANLPELMAAADVVVSAAGATCWELCLLGAPSLLIDLAPNQTPIAESLDRDGYAIHAGAADGMCVERLATQLQELLESQALRQRLSDRCRRLVDGSGAARVVAAMRSELLPIPQAAEKDETLAVRE